MNFLNHWKKEREFKRLYKKYNEFIRAALYWVGPRELKDDLVQETFLNAWKAWEKFKGDSQVRTWLYRIAMNCAKDVLRKSSHNSLEEFNENNFEGPNLILAENADFEERENFFSILESLSFDHREVLMLTYYFGYTVKEISSLTQRPQGTIKSQLYYGRKAFGVEWDKEKETTI